MKRLLNRLKVIVVAWIILQITVFCNSKYSTSFTQKGEGEIAEPIIILESFDNDEKLVNKLDFPKEYQFKVKNYTADKINEVDFLYNIELIKSNSTFPVKYKIIDLSENRELTINNGISEEIKISKQIKEEKIYKIIFYWEEIENEMSENLEFKLRLNLKQYKIGEY